MIFHDIQQNTDEWLDLRAGKLTGSSIAIVMANYDKAFSDAANKLAVSIACEQVTGEKGYSASYSNSHMDRGHEQEPIARALYEERYFVSVGNGGFFDCGNTGCSPDGLVYDEGLVEIKSVIAHVQYANMKRKGIDPTYKWQMNFNLLKTERDWIDSISYCADFPIEKQLHVVRVKRSSCKAKFNMIEDRLGQFFELVDEIKEAIS